MQQRQRIISGTVVYEDQLVAVYAPFEIIQENMAYASNQFFKYVLFIEK